MDSYDVIFIGGGYRTISFLTTNSDLVKLRLCIIEKSRSIGPGSYRNIDCQSSSFGASFFSEIKKSSKLDWINDNDLVKKTAFMDLPISLNYLSRAFESIAKVVAASLEPNSVLVNTEVVSINIRETNKYPVEVKLSTGGFCNANFVY